MVEQNYKGKDILRDWEHPISKTLLEKIRNTKIGPGEIKKLLSPYRTTQAPDDPELELINEGSLIEDEPIYAAQKEIGENRIKPGEGLTYDKIIKIMKRNEDKEKIKKLRKARKKR